MASEASVDFMHGVSYIAIDDQHLPDHSHSLRCDAWQHLNSGSITDSFLSSIPLLVIITSFPGLLEAFFSTEAKLELKLHLGTVWLPAHAQEACWGTYSSCSMNSLK